MATAVQPFAGNYELDRHHSTVQFAVRHQQVASFRASFADVDAWLTAEDDAIALEGRARVESISIAEPPEFRERVVRGTDFFDADTHPVITFRSTCVELGDDGTANVVGELTIRGGDASDQRARDIPANQGRVPEPVAELREEITRPYAVLIATPEYNGSIPGALKNALDWASRPFPDNCLRRKPVAVIGATTGLFGARWAQADLRRVLKTIGASVLDAELPVPDAHEAFTDDGRLREPRLAAGLCRIVSQLAQPTLQDAA